MPRTPRKYIIAPNALYHIVARGNNDRRIFRAVRDYKKFLSILKKVKELSPFYLYSLNLIPNHYHLEIETIETPISVIMHRVNFLFAKYFHHRYKTSGHLFQDRFYSSLINKEAYFWEAARYIDLNAVRAGLVERPEDYRWSSFPVYAQSKKKEKLIEELIDVEKFLEYGGEILEKARKEYLEYVKIGLELKRDQKFPINKKMI